MYPLIAILLFLVIIMLFKRSKKTLHMLQQNLYNKNNRYLKWLYKNEKFISLELISILLIILCITLFKDNGALILISLLLDIIIYVIDYINIRSESNYDKKHEKKSLVYTARIKRIIVTTFVIYVLPLIFMIISFKDVKFVFISLLIFLILVYLNRIIIYIACVLNKPFEKLVYFYYLHKASNKINSMNNLKVIGITGSYGKTSSKNILNDILDIKYNVLPTPKNYNSPYGLMITINTMLDKFTDVFIAEMGAYKEGEIKELCDIVHPKYGILTRIGEAHLESFGSREKIQQTKFELIESLPSDGIGILNKDDPKQVDYKLKNNCKIVWIGIDDKSADVIAENIKCDNKGVHFDAVFKGDKNKYKFESKLLGKHNIYNILASIALGNKFGIPKEDLIRAVKNVKPIEHRLEIKRINNFYMIDDAYNSNPEGAKNACLVLKMMPGTKVMVTPGMIELGKDEDYLNKEFGKQIADAADYVVLIGKEKTKPIYEGLIEKKYNKDNIIIYNDVKEAYKFLGGLPGEVYALFENDLPDSYNE